MIPILILRLVAALLVFLAAVISAFVLGG